MTDRARKLGLGGSEIKKRRGLMASVDRRPTFKPPVPEPPAPIRPMGADNGGLANNEFLVPLLRQLGKDPLAAFGADASRVTQLQGETNFRGSFVGAGGDMKAVAESLPFEAPILEARSDLGSGDAILLRAKGNPKKDEGATVLHEFSHRGFDKLDRAGVLPPLPVTRGGLALNEENVIRLLDFKTRRDKPGALAYFKDRGVPESSVKALARDSNFLLFLDQIRDATKKLRDARIDQAR